MRFVVESWGAHMTVEKKTKMCKMIEMGGCSKGADCPDAHDESELAPGAATAPPEVAGPNPEQATPAAATAAAQNPSAGAGGGKAKTAEDLARLPPKLRARLLKRGIIKEADLKPAQESSAPEPSAPCIANELSELLAPMPSEGEVPSAAQLAPEFAKAPGVANFAKAPSCPPVDVSSIGVVPLPIAPGPGWAGFSDDSLGAVPKAVPVPGWSPGDMSGVFAAPLQVPVMLGAPGLPLQAGDPNWPVSAAPAMDPPQFKAVSAASAKVKPAPPVKTEYASGPRLSAEALKRKRALEGGAAEEEEATSDTKRQAIESPADARAAAARAESADKAPVWIMKDGVVTELGSQKAAADQTASEAAPAREAKPVPQAAPPLGGEQAGGSSPSEVKPQLPLPAQPVPEGPPLPHSWVRVPHEDDFYYWNTVTNVVSWENPAEPKGKREEAKPKFTDEHKILWTDLGRIIGRQGINLKIIKASIGCDINVPKQKGQGKGKGKDKGKDKGKGKKGKYGTREEAFEKGVGRGIGTGDEKLADDQFVTVTISADTAYAAKGGKRCLEVMLGYGRHVEAALGLLGVEMKMPSVDEMTDGKGSAASKGQDGVDPMDPSSYSETPVGPWNAGMKKPGKGVRNAGPESRDSSTANAERF